jgi:hypothetical protein
MNAICDIKPFCFVALYRSVDIEGGTAYLIAASCV